MTKLDPELVRLLEKIPAEDLKDLLALHGAGSVGRQAKAHAKRYLATNWGGILFAVLGLSGIAYLLRSWGLF
jgi:hypothetical protein